MHNRRINHIAMKRLLTVRSAVFVGVLLRTESVLAVLRGIASTMLVAAFSVGVVDSSVVVLGTGNRYLASLISSGICIE